MKEIPPDPPQEINCLQGVRCFCGKMIFHEDGLHYLFDINFVLGIAGGFAVGAYVGYCLM